MRPFYWILIAGGVLAVALGALALRALGGDAAPAVASAAHLAGYDRLTTAITVWTAALLVAATLDRRMPAWTIALPLALLIAARMTAALVVRDPWVAFAKTHGLWQGSFDGTILVVAVVYLPLGGVATLAAFAIRRRRRGGSSGTLSGPRT